MLYAHRCEITINGDEAILSKNGKQLRVQFNVDAPSYEIYVADAVQINPELVVSTQDPNTGIRKIAVKMSGTGKNGVRSKAFHAEGAIIRTE